MSLVAATQLAHCHEMYDIPKPGQSHDSVTLNVCSRSLEVKTEGKQAFNLKSMVLISVFLSDFIVLIFCLTLCSRRSE